MGLCNHANEALSSPDVSIPVFHRISPNWLFRGDYNPTSDRSGETDGVTGRLGFLAGVRHQASRLTESLKAAALIECRFLLGLIQL